MTKSISLIHELNAQSAAYGQAIGQRAVCGDREAQVIMHAMFDMADKLNDGLLELVQSGMTYDTWLAFFTSSNSAENLKLIDPNGEGEMLTKFELILEKGDLPGYYNEVISTLVWNKETTALAKAATASLRGFLNTMMEE